MKITDLDGACRASLYVLCEDFRTIGTTVAVYRLYATLGRTPCHTFFVSVAAEGEADVPLVPCASLEEAAALYRTLLRGAVSPCHFPYVVADLEGAFGGV